MVSPTLPTRRAGSHVAHTCCQVDVLPKVRVRDGPDQHPRLLRPGRVRRPLGGRRRWAQGGEAVKDESLSRAILAAEHKVRIHTWRDLQCGDIETRSKG